MSLKPFTYPFPETRFLHAGPNVYKFKIRYGNSIREEEIENKEVIIQELENRERKTQQGLQETLASDITGVQKQDSEWGHSLPGPVVPSLQHNSPPPKERAASGFVGFLSSLFPFRYFFRKSSHS
ncbi:membrane-anchored junction protein isoform X5 [Rhinopithecus roxellana]|uniref:membrane-anchored junction protein isoform X5 n=1 Tax=Rhinopithecus roxellana TaxID=61622 RepID=UPI00123745C5|nr:membrane-anchored junction protein isoform X5 [Rhinopithecus roxellana]